MEINLDKLLEKKTGKMKYKEISKYPTVKKDIAIVVDKKITAGDIAMQIKKRLYLEWQCILQQILLHIQPIVITMEHGTV